MERNLTELYTSYVRYERARKPPFITFYFKKPLNLRSVVHRFVNS
ncbi:MAG: hypothetical protein JWO44_273 [Bacteroidetes bacterium]|nr:hypothetical protein [Bacteroidota bacterium]